MAEKKEPKVEPAHESTWGMTESAKQAWADKHGKRDRNKDAKAE